MYKPWMFKQRSFREQLNDDHGGNTGGGTKENDTESGDKSGDSGNGGSDDGGNDDADPAGKPRPTDGEAKMLKELMNKKTALRQTQADLAAVKAQLAAFDGLDASELRALLDEKKSLEQRKLEEKGDWDRLKAQMADENKKVVEEVTTKLTASEQRAASLAAKIAELTIGNSFIGSTFIKEELTLPPSKARALYGSHFETTEEGSVVAYDKPAGAAQRTVLVDSQGEPLNFEAALKKLVDADPDRDGITKSKKLPGAGSKSNEKGAPPASSFDEVRGTDRIAAALRAAQAAK